MLGIQSWIALPQAHEETDPGFEHIGAATLPLIEDRGLTARVIAGSAFGADVAGRHAVGLVLCRGRARGGRRRAARRRTTKSAPIYVVEGEVEIAGDRFEAPRLAGVPPRRPHHRARRPTRAA